MYPQLCSKRTISSGGTVQLEAFLQWKRRHSTWVSCCGTLYTQAGRAKTANTGRIISVFRARSCSRTTFLHSVQLKTKFSVTFENKNYTIKKKSRPVQFKFKTFTPSSQIFEHSDIRAVVWNTGLIINESLMLIAQLGPFSHTVTKLCLFPLLHVINSKIFFFQLL